MDESIRFSCVACGGKLKAPPDHAGTKARCSCGQVLTIPSPFTTPTVTSLTPSGDRIHWRSVAGRRKSWAVAGATLFVFISVGGVGLLVSRTWVGQPLESVSAPQPGRSSPTASEENTTVASAALQAPAVRSPDLPREVLSRQELHARLSRDVKFVGSLELETVTQYLGLDRQTYQKWNADLRLNNPLPQPFTLGSDLFLIEISGDGGSFEGFSVFGQESPIVGPSSYGLENNYEQAGHRVNQGGGRVNFSFFGWQGDSFGEVTSGESWTLEREFPEHTWLRDPTDICLVLPEMQVESSDGVERFRMLAYFSAPGEGNVWSFREQRLVPVNPEELRKVLSDPAASVVMKVLAANWLAQNFPKEAGAPLVVAAARLRQGQLLFSCLLLLKNLKASGLEGHTLELLQDKQTPNGIRSMSAQYLGAVRHAPSIEQLEKATADIDSVVKSGAIRALGAMGGGRAVQTLKAILNDKQRDDDHSVAAVSLAAIKDADANRALQDAINSGNQPALKALTEAGPPEMFEYFVGLVEKVKDSDQRDHLARGLKAAGQDKALPILLQMLEQAEPVSDKNFDGDGLVRVLVEMDKPAATATLTRLATAGNLRATLVLADSKNASVEAPLKTLATNGPSAVRRAALKGLQEHWSATNIDVFATSIGNSDLEIVRIAIDGIKESKSPRAVELLIPLLEHSDESVRWAAARAIEGSPLGDHASRVASVLVRSGDRTVVAACAKSLLAAKWRDPNAIPLMAKKMRDLKQEDIQYEFIALLKHLSNSALGPKDQEEYWHNRDGWHKKWAEWANRQ